MRKLLFSEVPRLCLHGRIPAFGRPGDKVIALLCWHPAAYQVELADQGAQSCIGKAASRGGCAENWGKGHLISRRNLHLRLEGWKVVMERFLVNQGRRKETKRWKWSL